MTKVYCKKYQEELPALDRPPYPGPRGEEIFNKYGGVKSNYFNENDDHMMEFNKNLIQSIDNFIKSLN